MRTSQDLAEASSAGTPAVTSSTPGMGRSATSARRTTVARPSGVAWSGLSFTRAIRSIMPPPGGHYTCSCTRAILRTHGKANRAVPPGQLPGHHHDLDRPAGPRDPAVPDGARDRLREPARLLPRLGHGRRVHLARAVARHGEADDGR